MSFKRMAFMLSALLMGACSSDSGGGGTSSTYSISGSVDTGQSASSFNYTPMSREVEDIDFTQLARTQCTDGKFYSVFCMSFTTPPVAAEGDVDCSNGGAFTVTGLPLNEPIYCVVRRYESDTAATGSNLGAIEIPAANLSGSTDTLVGSGDLTMNVTLGSDGSITAQVTGDQGSADNSTIDAAFTGANMNGVWALTCDSSNGGSQFSPGHCKCFLGEDSFGAAGYSNQDDCLNDSNGPGAAITGTVGLGIGLYIYEATANTAIPTDNNQTIPSGTEVKAISIWGTTGSPGSYVSSKTGGEGVTNLGGALTWGTTPLNPTVAITWTTGNISIKDGSNTSRTVNVPALPADPNIMTHGQWMTWLGNLASAAETGSFNCTFGPGDSNGNNNDANLANNIDCINQVLQAMDEDSVGATLPRMWVRPFCDQNGCDISDDAADSAKGYYNSNALSSARIEFEGWHLNYGSTWASTDNNSSIGPATGLDAGIGLEPATRYVFEPLHIMTNGAGFRQGHDFERHFECVASSAGPDQVANAACTGGGFFELVCFVAEDLSIKFIGTSSPMDVIFETAQAPVSARLYHHNGSSPQEVTPTGTDVLSMCSAATGGGSGTFMATATKQ